MEGYFSPILVNTITTRRRPGLGFRSNPMAGKRCAYGMKAKAKKKPKPKKK